MTAAHVGRRTAHRRRRLGQRIQLLVTDSLCTHYGNPPALGTIAVIASPCHDYRNHLVSGTFVEARRHGDLSV